MAASYSICLGTVGWGVWHSPDAGRSWVRHRAPFPLNSRIQALVAQPLGLVREQHAELDVVEAGQRQLEPALQHPPASQLISSASFCHDDAGGSSILRWW
jgi:hypothetical protein